MSSGGLLRVLKSMFCMCRDTRQCQDVLLSNQRCQNEKLGINEFDEFPLLEPPLDEDPIASLTPADLAAMRAAPNDNDDDSEYEDDDEGGDDKDDDE
jgi:hypothetical protein